LSRVAARRQSRLRAFLGVLRHIAISIRKSTGIYNRKVGMAKRLLPSLLLLGCHDDQVNALTQGTGPHVAGKRCLMPTR
jgi:hypothetical protein